MKQESSTKTAKHPKRTPWSNKTITNYRAAPFTDEIICNIYLIHSTCNLDVSSRLSTHQLLQSQSVFLSIIVDKIWADWIDQIGTNKSRLEQIETYLEQSWTEQNRIVADWNWLELCSARNTEAPSRVETICARQQQLNLARRYKLSLIHSDCQGRFQKRIQWNRV